ncbi:MAG: Rne/Rng family ribonuclease [Brevirhabdus sp.]
MAKKMLIDATHAEETRVVVVDGNKVEEFDFESLNKRQLAGNIYLAKVTRVEPSLQAAFVDYGGNRHGFLAFSEIHPDYYQIPVADREALLEEERAYAAAMAEEDEKPTKRRRSRRSRSKSAKTEVKDAVVTEEVAETGATDSADAQDTATETDGNTTAAPQTDAEGGAELQTAEASVSEASQEEAAEATSQADAASETDASGEEADDESKAAIPGMDVVEIDGDSAEPIDGFGEDDGAQADATERDDSIESVADEDVTDEIRPRRKPRARKYKIQEVIKVRQIMLVQVVKEERGNKGAALTTYLSLAGRYCVLMPNTARGGGISRKITNATDRKKLKEIAGEIEVPVGAGLIIRTAGAKRTKTEIKRDYEYLKRLWEQIRELTLKSIAPAPIYEEGNLIKRSIRDLYNREIDEIFVEGEAGYRVAKDFMKMLMPSHAKNVKHYTDPMPLYARYQVESYLAAMFNPTVQLKSGGYIVIGITEALVAIDVNSGRATKEGSIEDTALKTNLEAAEEVARQLRLRDLAGLIVIDFIDMEERKNNTAVEKRFKDRLKTDRARIQVGRISGFGLMEMSRQRLRPGMLEATTQPCPSCHGTGLIRSDDSLALSILRQLEEEGVRGRSKEVLVKAPVGIVNFLMNQKREHVAMIEARYGISIRIEADPFLISPDFTVERFKTATRSVPAPSAPVISIDMTSMPDLEEEEVEERNEDAAEAIEDEEKPKKRRRRRRRRRSGSAKAAEGQGAEGNEAPEEDGSTEEANQADAAEVTEEPVAAEEPKKTKSRSRSRRTSSSSKAKAAEAEAPEGAADEAAVEVKAEETASDAAEVAPVAEEKPKKKTTRKRSSSKKKEEPAPVATAEEAEPASPPTEDVPVEEAPVEKAVVEAEPAAEPEPQMAMADESAAAEPVAEEAPDKPKRRGWWSMGR